jgi:hypothetical protein
MKVNIEIDIDLLCCFHSFAMVSSVDVALHRMYNENHSRDISSRLVHVCPSVCYQAAIFIEHTELAFLGRCGQAGVSVR